MSIEETKEYERRFWAGWYGHRNGLNQAMRLKQWDHQMHYLPFIAKWGIGFRAPDESVAEIGCGPCGLAPWLGRRITVGVEPLAEFHRSNGVAYEKLGYSEIFTGTAQQYYAQWQVKEMLPFFDMVVCCNVLDHDPDPHELLDILTRLGNRLFLVYDVRHTVTKLHPGVTVDIGMPKGWRVANETMLPALCDADEIHGRRVLLMERM